MAIRSAAAFSSRSRRFSAFIRNPSIEASSAFTQTALFSGGIKEEIVAKTSASSISIDPSTSSVQSVTLDTNATFSMVNFDTGQSVTLIITQDGTGSRTGTFTSVKFPGGPPTLTTDANAIDVVTIIYDGTNYLGNIAQAFSAT
jgi:hypothetical protein